jgi:hypothetical protein
LMFVFLYFAVTGVQNLIQDGKELEKAQKEYDIAAAEAAQAQKEFQNVLKYNCANPVISSGGVSCPEDLPPVENVASQVAESNADTDSSMPGCTITGRDDIGKANSWSCP